MAVIYLASFQRVVHRVLSLSVNLPTSPEPPSLFDTGAVYHFSHTTYYVSVRAALFGLFPSQHLPFANRAESAGPVSHFQTNSQRFMALTGLALNDGLIARTLLHADTASLRWLQTN